MPLAQWPTCALGFVATDACWPKIGEAVEAALRQRFNVVDVLERSATVSAGVPKNAHPSDKHFRCNAYNLCATQSGAPPLSLKPEVDCCALRVVGAPIANTGLNDGGVLRVVFACPRATLVPLCPVTSLRASSLPVRRLTIRGHVGRAGTCPTMSSEAAWRAPGNVELSSWLLSAAPRAAFAGCLFS